MAFTKLSLVEIFKAKHNAAFSGRVPLGTCDRAGEEETLFKIQETCGDFCILQTFLDVLYVELQKVGEAL